MFFFLEKEEDHYDYPQDKMSRRKMKTLPHTTNPSSSEYYSYAVHTQPSLLGRLGKHLGKSSKKGPREGNIPLPPVPQGNTKTTDYYTVDRMPGTESKPDNTRQNVVSAAYLQVEEGQQTDNNDDDLYANEINPNQELSDIPNGLYVSIKERVIAPPVQVEDKTASEFPSYYNIKMTPSPSANRKGKQEEHSNTEVENNTSASLYYNVSPPEDKPLDDQDLYENVDY
jgi:hypothetical protein